MKSIARTPRLGLLEPTESALVLDNALRFASGIQSCFQLSRLTVVRRTVATLPARFSANAGDGGTRPC